MQNKINLTIPINSLGYGMHGMGYYKILKEGGYEVSVNKIGNGNDIEAASVPLLKDIGLYESIQEDIKRSNFDAPNLIVWHSNQFKHLLMKDVPNIGASAFELEPITEEEQKGFDSVDVAVTYSKWGLKQINHPKKTLVHGPVWSSYGLGLGDPVAIPGVEGKPIFISPGKWEARKGHPEFAEGITNIAHEGHDFVVFGFWNNIFTGHLAQPLEFLRNLGWTTVQMYTIRDQMVYVLKMKNALVVLFSHIEKYTDMLGYYAMADGAISLSKGEGWDMPIVDMLGLKIPVLMTNNTAHIEYINYDFYVPSSNLQIANDGIFFKGQGYWSHLPKVAACNIMRNFILDKSRKKMFWSDEYKYKFNSIKNPKNIFNQLETSISMAEACRIKK